MRELLLCECLLQSVQRVFINKGVIVFISSTEKAVIQAAIESLRVGLADATTEILQLKAKIKALEDKGAPKLPKKTEEQLQAELKKARRRAYGRAYYQRKKEREANVSS